MAESPGATPSQLGLDRLLHHAPNVPLVPGTANAAHPEADMSVGEITLDAATLATFVAIESRSNDVPIG
ncbi:hypothetical protein [Streptomyces sp. NPDC004042]|uniref:hypothetical protein n=1 Tax=Streptomyces sp. NPDC004042 TaxID=3154451 RepID=UPI0033B82F4E